MEILLDVFFRWQVSRGGERGGKGKTVNWIRRSACLSRSWREAVIVKEKSSIKRQEVEERWGTATMRFREWNDSWVETGSFNWSIISRHWRIPLPAATGNKNNSRQTVIYTASTALHNRSIFSSERIVSWKSSLDATVRDAINSSLDTFDSNSLGFRTPRETFRRRTAGMKTIFSPRNEGSRVLIA